MPTRDELMAEMTASLTAAGFRLATPEDYDGDFSTMQVWTHAEANFVIPIMKSETPSVH